MRWHLTGQVGVQGIRLSVFVILAWFLEPAEFGLMAMALMVTGFLDMFVDLGTGQALIQRERLSQGLLSSVFWANFTVGAAAALLLWCSSGLVASLFAAPELQAVVRVVSPIFMLSAMAVVHAASLQREMRFAAVARVQLSGAVANGLVAVGVAASGGGVWAMVAGFYAGSTTHLVGYFLASRWWPSWQCSLRDLREVANFSLNLTAVNLVGYLFSHSDKLIIGRFLGAEALGFYSLARKIIWQPTKALGTSMSGVLFARFARMQNDLAGIRSRFLLANSGLSLVLLPGICGIALLARPLVLCSLGEQWETVADVLTVLAPAGFLMLVTLPGGALYRAMGRTDLLLRWSLLRGVIVSLSYWLGVPWGVQGVATGYAFAMALVLLPGLWISCGLVGLSAEKLLLCHRHAAAASAVMTAVVIAVRFSAEAAGCSPGQVVLLGSVVGAAVYGAGVWLYRPPVVQLLVDRFRGLRSA